MSERIGAPMAPPASLHDSYPIGWILTYRHRNGATARSGLRLIGVVAGAPVLDPDTGVELIPLAEPGDTQYTPTRWISDNDVIGIEPRGAGLDR
ncbi:hypothetical protein OG943_14220 [Amycolatopsis sp. NBC_00345]|uniref:hypothetical protein n=1 Tax=Amycolatopsis sp. NBC_00345 TaxID=2975955 RepID=UPI002E264209